MRIVVGCDEAACNLKQTVIEYIKEYHPDIELTDIGTFSRKKVLYPDIAHQAAMEVKDKNFDRGILLCGTGIGMAICANKVEGIRAAVCHDVYSAERSRKSNDAQILCMGERVIGPELAKCIVEIWLNSEFAGGGSAEKVKRICELEKVFGAEEK